MTDKNVSFRWKENRFGESDWVAEQRRYMISSFVLIAFNSFPFAIYIFSVQVSFGKRSRRACIQH